MKPESKTLVHNIRQASRSIIRELGLLNEKNPLTGFTLSEGHTLLELARQETLTVGDLAKVLRLDKSTTSRIVARLSKQGLINFTAANTDQRRRPFQLTTKGKHGVRQINNKIDLQVSEALAKLSPSQSSHVLSGLTLYAQALKKSRQVASYQIRPIKAVDNSKIAKIIRAVFAEHGLGKGPGFSVNDPEVDYLFQTYNTPGSAYFVAKLGTELVGGCGIAQLKGATGSVCELQKMYLLKHARGFGIGAKLLTQCLEQAKKFGYKLCYLESVEKFDNALKLYESFGFKRIKKAMGKTGHSIACDCYYTKRL